jgi:hypothetical protein
MLFSCRMKRLMNIAAILLLASSFAACKSQDEKNQEAVENAREKVVDKQEKVEDRTIAAEKAKAELNQARIDFIMAVDKRLADLDARIVAAKTNSALDQGKIATLRAEAAAIRARAVDEAQPFAEDTRTSFERVIKDLEAALSPDDANK